MKVTDILHEVKELQKKTNDNIAVINHNSTVISEAIKGINESLRASTSNAKFMLENNAKLIKNASFKDKIILVVVVTMAFLVGFKLQDITSFFGV